MRIIEFLFINQKNNPQPHIPDNCIIVIPFL